MKTAVILILAGVVSGGLNGFFGTGGGLVIFSTLTFLGCDTRRALASANLGVLVLSLVSFMLYLKTGALGKATLELFLKKDLALALLGGAAGAYLSGKISPKLLKKIFSALVVFCGLRMVLS